MNTPLARRLWASCVSQHRSRAARLGNWRRWHRHDAILARLGEVERIAKRESRKFARHIDIRDLISAGYVGLVEASNRYHPDCGGWEQFSYFRIMGAIIDSQKRRVFREEQNLSIDRPVELLHEARPNTRRDAIQDQSPLPDELACKCQIETRLESVIAGLPQPDQGILRSQLAGDSTGATARLVGLSRKRVVEQLALARACVVAEMRGQPWPLAAEMRAE